jgi:transketolase
MTPISDERIYILANRARLLGLRAVHRSRSGHPGGSLSAADILSVLYWRVMNIDPAYPKDPGRDRFVLSKGHCTPALYAVLALRGYFPEKDLELFRSIEGNLSGHAEMNHVKGVDMSTGSLGQGLSAAVGMGLAARLDQKNYRVYCLMGDGEQAEGQIWEAAMSAAKYSLDNLCGIVDINGLQIDGKTKDIMPTEPLNEKWRSFGWNTVEADGHDLRSLTDAFERSAKTKGRPTVVLAKTVKGKGVSYMENEAGWHGKAPDDRQMADAEAELLDIIAEWEAADSGR